MGNSFGKVFRITTWGESHGESLGVVIDGCPSLLPLNEADIQFDLNRRRPGQSNLTSSRNEPDLVNIVSGIYQGQTLGTPIAMIVKNQDAKPQDYLSMQDKYRPSHADFTYQAKYGIRNPEGGGRSSARETIGRIAAGSIAKKILSHVNEIEIRAYVESIHNLKMPPLDHFPTIEEIDSSPIRCPDQETAHKMATLVQEVRNQGDSVGGIIICRIRNVPVGLGEPVFDRLEADLAKAMLSIPATKGFEIGSGFSGTQMKGSEHNDIFYQKESSIGTLTNFSGGIQGGISNGEEIYFRVAFKPTATILKAQNTIDKFGNSVQLEGQGRHDPCVLPRAVPIVEAMAALVLVDHWMIHQGRSLKLTSKPV